MSPSATPRQRTWLITGSSNGFGLALTRHVLAMGDNVIATSRDPSKTPKLLKEAETQSNGRWIALDVTWSQDKLQDILEEVQTSFPGGVDVVVNNAAYSVLGAIEDVTEEEAKDEFETNLWGPLRIIKAFLPIMRERGSGTIVNISSLLGITSWPGCGMYSASKFALEGVSQALAAEVASFGIRVLLVEPGSFNTNFLSSGAMQAAEPSEPYQIPHNVGVSLQNEQNADGNEPGNVDKAVKVIYDTVSGNIPNLSKVLRLALGDDCWEYGVAHLKNVMNDFEACKEIAHSVQHD